MNSPINNRVLLFLSLVTIVVIAAAAFFVTPELARTFISRFTGEKVALEGRVYVTLTAGGLDAAYYFDLGKKSLVPVSRAGTEVSRQVVFSPSKDRYAYHCAPTNDRSGVCVSYPQTGEHYAITQNALKSKRFFRWSPDGKNILYTAQATSSSADSVDPNDWVIFMADAFGGGETQVATGSTPFFSPDSGTIYFLQKDGLHGKILATGETALVWPIKGGVANRFMSIGISPDGSKLAWTNPLSNQNKGSLNLFNVTSWHPFAIKSESKIQIRASQVTFAPESSALAFNTLETEREEPAIYIYNFKSAPKKIFNLQTYDKNVYLTDWQK